jgi:hypothetical protein
MKIELVIIPISGILVTVVILIGAPCRLNEYDLTYNYYSDYHRGNYMANPHIKYQPDGGS